MDITEKYVIERRIKALNRAIKDCLKIAGEHQKAIENIQENTKKLLEWKGEAIEQLKEATNQKRKF